MQSLDLNVSNNLLTTPTSLPFSSTFAAMDDVANNPGNITPPDFDFNIPCRFFKSSFARSLSLNNPSSHFQCKSLDYDINNIRSHNNNNNNTTNNGIGNFFNSCGNDSLQNIVVPPVVQRMSRVGRSRTTTQITTAAMSISGNINISINAKNEVSSSDESCSSNLPPALPARRPMPVTTNANTKNNNNCSSSSSSSNNTDSSNGSISELQPQRKQQQLPLLTQLRQQQQNKNSNNKNSNGIANANGIGNSYANDSGCGNGSGCANISSNANNANSGGNVSSVIHGNFNKLTINHALQLQQQLQQQQQQQHKELSIDHNIRRNVWPNDNVEQDFNCYDDTQLETTSVSSKSNYSKDGVAAEHKKPPLPLPLTQPTTFDNDMNIQAVLLHTQVDTLQWQLKQVETSCEMYRAVMEEVVRFLDRYHNHKQNDHNNMEQISRSKSLYQVYAGGHENNPHSDESMATSYFRTRSSTDLIDVKQSPHLQPPPASTHNNAATVVNSKHKKLSEPNYDVVAPMNSYSTFKDFTWRRSPKQKQNDNRTHTPAVNNMEEKLNQEAFRLSRTIHNLLNTSTQQPNLTQRRNSLSALNLSRLNVKTPNGSTLALHTPGIHNSTTLTLSPNTSEVDTLVNAAASTVVAPPKTATLANTDMLFLRAANIRDSRLSLHSTTDSSVHSTTSSSCTTSCSSKVETDDEPTLPYISGAHLCNNNSSINKNINKQSLPLCSTTEDESGFSSISSFQEIGVPLCSTPSKKCTSLRGKQHGVTTNERQSIEDQNVESLDHTLTNSTPVPSPTRNAKHPNNIVGVPISSICETSNRWESPTKAYRTTNKRFSTLSNDDSTTVLWV